jgi:hypothetical protein
MKPAARRPLLLCALAAAAALSILLVAPPPLAAHLSSLLLAFPASPYAGGPKLVVLLAGQSNMAGRGLAPSLLPPQFRPHPRVLRLAASRRWVVAAPPLHADIDTHKACGLGPAMPFAHRLLHAASPDLVLGLVPCAVGGTRIWMWAKGEPLYEAAVARGRAAVAAGGGTLGAVLWFQGESDTIELDDATAYGGRMERLVNDFRADLGMPNLLVIQVSTRIPLFFSFPHSPCVSSWRQLDRFYFFIHGHGRIPHCYAKPKSFFFL